MDIPSFVQSHLLDPLKQYNTVLQDTLVELITQKLTELYRLTKNFPEIVSPNKSRLDILEAISAQFLFTIREDGDIEEQIGILENILYVYRKRGSIDTIENMWKYYGGKLPKYVKIRKPSDGIFRYSISELSGTDRFQDNGMYRPGTYEIRLTNNTYPIPELKEFLLKELVAAGNTVHFSSDTSLELKEDNSYAYKIYGNTIVLKSEYEEVTDE